MGREPRGAHTNRAPSRCHQTCSFRQPSPAAAAAPRAADRSAPICRGTCARRHRRRGARTKRSRRPAPVGDRPRRRQSHVQAAAVHAGRRQRRPLAPISPRPAIQVVISYDTDRVGPDIRSPVSCGICWKENDRLLSATERRDSVIAGIGSTASSAFASGQPSRLRGLTHDNQRYVNLGRENPRDKPNPTRGNLTARSSISRHRLPPPDPPATGAGTPPSSLARLEHACLSSCGIRCVAHGAIPLVEPSRQFGRISSVAAQILRLVVVVGFLARCATAAGAPSPDPDGFPGLCEVCGAWRPASLPDARATSASRRPRSSDCRSCAETRRAAENACFFGFKAAPRPA